MDDPPLPQCCGYLVRPLGFGDRLPNHICMATAIATIYSGSIEGVAVPDNGVWPVPADRDRSLAFVVRQWAEHTPSQLGKALAKDPGWRYEVRWLTGYLGAQTEETDSDDGRARLLEAIAVRLRAHGLPYCPGMARYLYACAEGSGEGEPTTGLLVSSFAYVPADQTKPFRFDANPEVRIAGPLEWTSDELLRNVKKVTIAHRDWLRNTGRNPLTSPVHHLYSAPEPRAKKTHDYFEEAMAERQSLHDLLINESQYTFDKAFKEFIYMIYHRVLERRKKDAPDGKAPPPEPGWRDRVYSTMREFYPQELYP